MAPEAGGVDGGDAVAIVRRWRRQIHRARGGRRVFGMVGATNVANETKEFKPAQSFYPLDAFVPADGDTVGMLVGGPLPGPMTLGQPWLVPPAPRAYDDPREAAFADPRRVDHPARCFLEPVVVPRSLEEYPFTRTYIRATADSADAPGAAAFDAAAEQARNSPAWRYHGIATNHMIAQNRPDELVAILLALVDDDNATASA